jgi:hypothetical protein
MPIDPSPSPSPNPNEPIVIPISLTPQGWNMLLGYMLDAPYRLAAPIIAQITKNQSDQSGGADANSDADADVGADVTPRAALVSNGKDGRDARSTK